MTTKAIFSDLHELVMSQYAPVPIEDFNPNFTVYGELFGLGSDIDFNSFCRK